MKLFFAIIVGFLLSIFGGYVLSILWEWFMVSIFNLPKLNIPQAMGIHLISGYLTGHYRPNNEEDLDYIGMAAYLIGKPLIALFFGWIIVSFI